MKSIAEHFPNVVLAEGGAWTESDLISQGYSHPNLANARRRFAIIAWSDRFGGFHYPRWQFDDQFQVIPAIAEILRIYRSRDSLYVMSQFLYTDSSRKSLLELIRSGRGAKALTLARARQREEKLADDMLPEQVAELKKRIQEHEDPVRYVIVSTLFRRTLLVYDVAENLYSHGHISAGSLIKDKKLAEVIAGHLGKGIKNADFHILPVRRNRKGYRSVETFPGRKGEKPWRPSFQNVDHTPEFVPITSPDARDTFVDAMVFAGEHRKWIVESLSACVDRKAAVVLLEQRCKLSRRQAETVLEMRLWAYTKKARADLVKELQKAIQISAS